MSPSAGTTLGEIIRRQREMQEHSMRQFARMVGISNPYLSQIERGLREPSEQVLRGIAESLETTVDVLYEQAGLRPDGDEEAPAVIVAVQEDPALTARQREALIEVYDAFTGRRTSRRRRRASRPNTDRSQERSDR